MNKNIVYAFLGYFLLMLASCSENPADATSKHIYGEDEAPYLKVNTEATNSVGLKFPIERLEPQYISLVDYAEKFHKLLGLTVDEALTGLTNSSVIFYNINPARLSWNKAPMTKGTTGWYYNTAGGITDSSNGIATLELDKESKSLKVEVVEGAPVGSSITMHVGFALNGPDYDDYIRFSISLAVTDPGRIVVSETIPAGDYATFSIDFADYQEAIVACMDLSVKEFSDAVSDASGPIAMYIVDGEGNWDKESSYTANGIGYWMNNQGRPCGWGATGCTYFIETGDACVNIGRFPGIASGEVHCIRFVYANKEDNSKFVEFIITATME